MKRLIAGIAGVAAAASLAACGGDDDAPIVPVQTTTTPVSQLSQNEFINQADSICEESNAALASLSTSGSGSELASTISEQQDVYSGMADQIDALGPPPEDEETLADYLDALDAVVDTLDKQHLAAERDDTSQVEALSTDVDSAVSDAQQAADDFGLKECAQPGGTSVSDTGTDTGTDTGAATTPAPAPTTTTPAATRNCSPPRRRCATRCGRRSRLPARRASPAPSAASPTSSAPRPRPSGCAPPRRGRAPER
jgi:hypothetical protein